MSSFYRLRCKKCGKEKIVFSNATSEIKCECGALLVQPTGGKIHLVNADVLEELGKWDRYAKT